MSKAFTGVGPCRIAEAANNGLLFLDEIGNSGSMRGYDLRAIEEKRFLPVGSDMKWSVSS
jgi:sigma54-dependent transcription regulator